MSSGVYIAGKQYVNSTGHYKALYWKNGSPVDLTDGTNDAYARGIVVRGNDVLVAGAERKGANDVAMLWRNGVATQLSDGLFNIKVYALAVSGDDVYVGGSEYHDGNTPYNIAKYWKNGKEIILGANFEEIYAMTVSGNDVYAAGYKDHKATYWKNGIPHPLTDGTTDAGATAITVSGQDIYVTCVEAIGLQNAISYFKNGTKFPLGTYYGADVNSINVVGTDLYIGGSTNEPPDIGYKIVYWKNGVPTIVTDRSEDNFEFSMVVRHNDIYMAAIKSTNTTRTAKYFKNGTAMVLADASPNSYALSLFVDN